MRTIIDLQDHQIRELAVLCQQTRLSRAELIRRAVDEFLQQHGHDRDDSAFGLWKDRVEDGLEYQQRIRDEWSE
jgi:metal-responsive CopG/Arc/MetJ family transcriptional regulator